MRRRKPSDLADHFAFRSMITPFMIRVLYVLGTLLILCMGVYEIGEQLFRLHTNPNNAVVRLFLILLSMPIALVLFRMTCEFLILFFRIHESLEGVRRNTEASTNG